MPNRQRKSLSLVHSKETIGSVSFINPETRLAIETVPLYVGESASDFEVLQRARRSFNMMRIPVGCSVFHMHHLDNAIRRVFYKEVKVEHRFAWAPVRLHNGRLTWLTRYVVKREGGESQPFKLYSLREHNRGSEPFAY